MRRLLYALLAVFLLAGSQIWAGQQAEDNFKKLSAEILGELYKLYPVDATDMGIHDYDDSFTDYSRKNVSGNYSKFKTYITRLYKYRNLGLPVDLQIDMKALRANCESVMLDLGKISSHKKNPSVYTDQAIMGLYYLMISEQTTLADRLDAILGRMNNLEKLLEQGRNNLTSIPPIWLEEGKKQVDETINYYQETADELQKQFPDQKDRINQAAQKALNALDLFKSFLDGAQPGPPGSFAIGREYFDYILEHLHLLGFDSDSLLKIGLHLVDSLQARYDERKAYYDSVGTVRDGFVPTSFSRQDYIDYLGWEMNNIKAFIVEKDLFTISPNMSDCKVVEAPDYLSGVISGYAYTAVPVFHTRGEGRFFIPKIPEFDNDSLREYYYRWAVNRYTRNVTIHEVWPGHHLQQESVRLSNLSDVRKSQRNTVFIEGWALYCEELMYNAGYYKDRPEDELIILRNTLFRALRVVVDVKLQTGQFSFDDAVDYISQYFPGMQDYIKREVTRYTMTPGQPMSYLVGKLAILKLRAKVKAREGDKFSLKSFHDRLLSVGSVPPSLISMKLLR